MCVCVAHTKPGARAKRGTASCTRYSYPDATTVDGRYHWHVQPGDGRERLLHAEDQLLQLQRIARCVLTCCNSLVHRAKYQQRNLQRQAPCNTAKSSVTT